MISLSAKSRETGKNESKEGLLAVLYGPKVKSQPISIDLKEFKKVYHTAGSSSLISLVVGEKKFSVLIHDVQTDPMTGEYKHVDFYQPILTEEVEVEVPLVFEGEAPAVKDLAGTLVKGFQELKVRALPEHLPHEVKVDVSKLLTFEDVIFVKDIEMPKGVKIDNDPEAIVASVLPPQKVEEELEKPIEENVEAVEQVEKEGGEAAEAEGSAEPENK